ncbi:PH domain-containing protein [Streptomyces noursei]|nr:membrane-flanked domain-containing protein [Streptomyces noursei ATCC 11455]MCZ0994902.1 PH domain-containing protein [Streptomyces noursei]
MPGAGQTGARERRLHPVTPLRRAWAPLTAVVFLLKQDWIREWLTDLDWGWLAAGGLLAVLASAAYGAQSWRCTYYALTATELRIRSGLFFRRTAHIRLERLQAVEIAEPLLARLVGVAKLKLDVIGTEAKDELAYLGKREARELRAELLALAAGFTPQDAQAAGEAPARELARVAPKTLATAVLLHNAVGWALLTSAIGTVAAWWALDSVWAILAAATTGLGLVWAATGGRFMGEYDWTVAKSPDGLRLDHGLLDRKHETVPPGRVQAVRVQRPLLWRMLHRDWVRVELDVAGSDNSLLLPVADTATAQRVIACILPRTDLAEVRAALRPAPRRARGRAPVRAGCYAFAVHGEVFAASSGLLTPTLSLVPHAKVQSVRGRQGPWKRALGLRDVMVDTGADTTVVAALRPADEALEIIAGQAERSRTGRQEARPDRWMSEVLAK